MVIFCLFICFIRIMTESWCYSQVEKSSLRGVFRGIAQSYQPREFKAATPTNEHFHTILGSGVVLDAIIGRGVARPFETEVRRLSTPDDDFFAIEICKPNVNTSEAVVCICHGLESSTRAPLVTNMASALHERGFSAVLVGFRGCSGEDNASARAYHLGFTDDLKIGATTKLTLILTLSLTLTLTVTTTDSCGTRQRTLSTQKDLREWVFFGRKRCLEVPW